MLGLALQSTLGDLFSGVVLNMAKPYRPGDWVILDGGLQGSVVETNWRATQILTLTNDLAIVPNSVIAKARLINASRPNDAHGLTVTIRLDATVPPLVTVQILETAMLSCNHILRIPKAEVAIRLMDAIAVECELTFFVASVDQGPDAQNEVFDPRLPPLYSGWYPAGASSRERCCPSAQDDAAGSARFAAPTT